MVSNRMKTTLSIFTLFVAAALFIGGCKKDAPQGIYDPNYQNSFVAPTVTSILPETHPYILGGVTTILINGSGFGTDTSKLRVYFNSTVVKISSITPTQIKILAPNMIQDSIKVRILVDGADKFSNLNYVSIRSAVISVKEVDTTKFTPYAITFDKNNNLYVSVVTKAGVSDGIYSVTPGGTVTQFALRGTEPYFTGIKFRKDSLYAARRVNRIVSRNSATTAMNIFSGVLATTIEDFDYDSKRIMWAAGNTANGGILRIDSLKVVKQQFPFSGVIRSVRYYNNALYVSNEAPDSTNAVYKIPFATDSTLGTAEKYFDLTAVTGSKLNKVYGITFDNQGNLYVGTNAPAGIYVVAPDKSAQMLYNGIIGPNCLYFAWGNDSYLYVVREKAYTTSPATGVFKIDMLGKLSAPYYGL